MIRGSNSESRKSCQPLCVPPSLCDTEHVHSHCNPNQLQRQPNIWRVCPALCRVVSITQMTLYRLNFSHPKEIVLLQNSSNNATTYIYDKFCITVVVFVVFVVVVVDDDDEDDPKTVSINYRFNLSQQCSHYSDYAMNVRADKSQMGVRAVARRQDRLWCPFGGSFTGAKVGGGGGVGLIPSTRLLSSAKFKHVWSCNSTHFICFHDMRSGNFTVWCFKSNVCVLIASHLRHV
jgi:hypothetical protein